MANATNYLEKKLCEHILGIAEFTMPATAYLALLSDNPTETGSQTSEVSGGSYARIAITDKMDEAGATDGTSVNDEVITFGPATADWNGGDPIAFAGIMDASTGGNMLVYIALDTPQVVLNNGNLQFPVGELAISVA